MTDVVLWPPPQQASIGRQRFAAGEPATTIGPGHRAEGYRLRVTADGAQIEASDEAGLARGQATLAQLTGAEGVAEADITDWPDLPVRGVMFDISRDKVPTMETLRGIVDWMAAWKLNHLQLYMEHTFAYSGRDEVWGKASPMTAAEITELKAYAADRHVELAANQNSLGHMERWLCRESYRRLAIAPEAYIDERGRGHYPSTLDPGDPGSLALVTSLLSELVPLFDSPIVNVGLDEPWELTPDRAPEYGAYVRSLRASSALDGRQMMMWGDIVSRHPELVPGIAEGVTVLEWGYEADHPFEENCARLAEAGLPFWVCPGTSSWNSLLGRWTNARENCLSAARVAVAQGGSGYLITDWGDHGHLQPLPVSLPGLAAGAGASWNAGAAAKTDPISGFTAVLSGVRLDRTPLGPERARALLELGDAHLAVETQSPNTVSVLLHLIWPQLRVGQRSTEGLDGAQLDAYLGALDDGLARAGADGDDLLSQELGLVVDLAKLMVDDARARLAVDGSLASVPEKTRLQLAERVPALADRHRSLWTRRNRPGGLEDSAGRIENLERCYREGRGRDLVPAWAVPDDRGRDKPKASRAGGRQGRDRPKGKRTGRSGA